MINTPGAVRAGSCWGTALSGLSLTARNSAAAPVRSANQKRYPTLPNSLRGLQQFLVMRCRVPADEVRQRCGSLKLDGYTLNQVAQSEADLPKLDAAAGLDRVHVQARDRDHGSHNPIAFSE